MTTIDSVLKEERTFSPTSGFKENARIASEQEFDRLTERAKADPEGYWSEVALELEWFAPWKQVSSWNPPDAKWFVDGKTNLSFNCLDRYLENDFHKTALIWEGEPGDSETLSFGELQAEVCRAANALTDLGIKKGDCVAIYMPMLVETAIAMLACTRIGAVHTVVFGGFSAEALKDRLIDAQVKCVITADGGHRRGKSLPLKIAVDEAVQGTAVEKVLVVRRTQTEVNWDEQRDVWWHETVDEADAEHDAVHMDAEDPLFILYTSGTTGKPKGILHTTGGYMVGAYQSTKLVFDIQENDVYWCTADVGWITGHTYSLYGALLNKTTTVMYEGAPNHPNPDRFWQIVEKHKVTTLYTAPTAIRAFMKWGDKWPLKHDLSSLRLLGSVGEPINPEAWMWYHKIIGKEKCPIVDTWWQTETGSIMISPLPGAIATKPGSCTKPLPGIAAKIVDEKGEPVSPGKGGLLVIDKPWPSMLRTIHGDHERFKSTYFSNVDGAYFVGDGARQDDDGYFWILGRVDDVINVSGHRLSTMEVESALVAHADVAEAAVVARPDDLTGQAIVAFVTPMDIKNCSGLEDTLVAHVATQIGALAKPKSIVLCETLPKTRSGKIMRRLLRDVACGKKTTGDTSTLEDANALNVLAQAD